LPGALAATITGDDFLPRWWQIVIVPDNTDFMIPWPPKRIQPL